MSTQPAALTGLKSLAITGMTALLVACFGGSDDDVSSGSSPVVARGVITQIGSIHVNGVKYELPTGGSYSSDDDDTVDDSVYQVGQMVSIKGTINDDRVTGIATEVEYEAEIEGTSVNGVINGITILRTQNTNSPGIPAVPAPLPDGRYEVSGVWITDFSIEATYIKTDDDGDNIDEIKGEVQIVNSASSFDVKDITFNMAGGGAHGVSQGDYVEVHFDSCLGVSPDIVCTASLVQIEDGIFDQAEGYEIEVEGAVDKTPSDCPPQARIKVDDICVDIDSKPAEWLDGLEQGKFDDLVQGSRVEVEGHMVSDPVRDYLRADKVKGRGNRVRVSSIASNVVGNAFKLVEGNIDVITMSGVTVFEDGLSLGNIDAEIVEVRGVRTKPSEMLAIRIKSTGLSNSGNRHEIRAEVDVDGANTTNDTLTVMGIVTEANACTELEIDDMVISGDEVCDTTEQGIDDFLTLVDDDTDAANGPRSVVEIGVNITTGDGGADPYTADEWEVEEEDD